MWGGGELADAWPAAPDEDLYSRVRPSNVETLLVSGDAGLRDAAAGGHAGAAPVPAKRPPGRAARVRAHGSFWAQQPEAGTHLVNTYLDTGKVDRSLYKPQRVDFTPDVTQTALAKGIAGAIVGLALLMVLSLLLMARRVHKRGGYGRKASALLRSLYPVVLGLGGWFLAVLVVLTTMPGTPVDGELLSALSIGAPIGLGVYFAWVRRDWSARTKSIGFAAAAGGALVGAWLGFNATAGLLALSRRSPPPRWART